MKVSIDSVIDHAKFRLGLRDTTYADADLERLIDEGARQMGNLSGIVINCTTLDIDCSKAELPASYTEVICFMFLGEGCSGCCQNFSFDPATEPNPYPPTTCTCSNYYVYNRNVLTEFCGMGVNACGFEGGFAIQGGFLCFPSTVTATQVKVWYRGWNQDEDSIMILDELDQRGLSAYAAYMYASAGQNYKAYPQRKEFQQEWIAQRGKRIAEDFKAEAKRNNWVWAAVAKGILLNPHNLIDQNF